MEIVYKQNTNSHSKFLTFFLSLGGSASAVDLVQREVQQINEVLDVMAFGLMLNCQLFTFVKLETVDDDFILLDWSENGTCSMYQGDVLACQQSTSH
jgi:hypothetical protein